MTPTRKQVLHDVTVENCKFLRSVYMAGISGIPAGDGAESLGSRETESGCGGGTDTHLGVYLVLLCLLKSWCVYRFGMLNQ